VKYLLDTCLISELVKKEPSAEVIAWLDEQDEHCLFLSVLTFGELQKGIAKLPDSVRKSELQAWADHDLVDRFAGRILSVDLKTALAWGSMQGEAESMGQKLPVMDSLIAATAAVHRLTVVTRNVKDIGRCNTPVLNPWPQ
jgi:toxin FitB